MTNSTPKLNRNKIERQGSPNAMKQKPFHYQRSNNSFNTSNPTFYNNSGYNGSRSVSKTPPSSNSARSKPLPIVIANRQNYSPPCSAPRSIPGRTTPPRNSINGDNCSPRGSPTSSPFYAGAKFSEPPSPASLPKPPMHWTGLVMGTCRDQVNSSLISQHFKMLLNVKA